MKFKKNKQLKFYMKIKMVNKIKNSWKKNKLKKERMLLNKKNNKIQIKKMKAI